MAIEERWFLLPPPAAPREQQDIHGRLFISVRWNGRARDPEPSFNLAMAVLKTSSPGRTVRRLHRVHGGTPPRV